MERSWEEDEATYFIEYLEKLQSENLNSKGRLPDGPWVNAVQDLCDLCDAFGDKLSRTTLLRKEQILAWIAGLSSPKLMADEVQELEQSREVLDAIADLSGDEMERYVQDLDDTMADDNEFDDWG